jgi:hypothetical protein
MYYRDPKCVCVSDSIALANTVVAWLGGNGIEAEVMNELTMGGFEGLTAFLPGKLSLRGVEVWVRKWADAESARTLADEHVAKLAAERSERENRQGNIEVVCEDCHKTSIFPASLQGTIQDCSHCRATLDVPDANDDWDVGEPEDSGEE